jgi:hypothetical protein
MIVARGLFYVSLVATLFAVFGFTLMSGDESSWPGWALAMVVAFVITFAVVHFRPSFLVVPRAAIGRFIARAAGWTILAYVGGGLVIIGLAYLLMPPHYLSTEAALTAYGLAALVPISFAPAVGLALAWWHVRSNSTIERDARNGTARPSL